MNKHMKSLDQLNASLKTLIIQAPGLTTKIGMLRSLYGEIENAKFAGYDYGSILAELIKNGFGKTTRNQFYGLMNRIRLEQRYLAPDTLAPIKNHGEYCQEREYAILQKSRLNIPEARSTLIPANVDELRSTSRKFDIDPTNFD